MAVMDIGSCWVFVEIGGIDLATKETCRVSRRRFIIIYANLACLARHYNERQKSPKSRESHRRKPLLHKATA